LIDSEGRQHTVAIPVDLDTFFNKFGPDAFIHGGGNGSYTPKSLCNGTTYYVNTVPPRFKHDPLTSNNLKLQQAHQGYHSTAVKPEFVQYAPQPPRSMVGSSVIPGTFSSATSIMPTKLQQPQVPLAPPPPPPLPSSVTNPV